MKSFRTLGWAAAGAVAVIGAAVMLYDPQDAASTPFCSQLEPIKQTIAATEVGIPVQSRRAQHLFERVIAQFAALARVAPPAVERDAQLVASFYRKYRRAAQRNAVARFTESPAWDEGGEAQARVAAYGDAACGVQIDP